MLYPKNKENTLSENTFKSPTAEYCGTPFWSWNTLVTDTLVKEQIDVFKQMGFGGFHVHPRTGLQTPYLQDEYMRLVKLANQEAKSKNMLCWLYDEDRYPSGAAGGIVTADHTTRSRWLVLTRTLRSEGYCNTQEEFVNKWSQGEKPCGYYVTSYRVRLEDNCLAEYSRVASEAVDNEEGLVWHAYLELMEESAWYNDQAYLDCMNKAAVERFIQVTHQVYKKELGEDFGKSIPAIFTDEPHVKGRQTLPFATSVKDITVTYTESFGQTYLTTHGYDILDYLPELLWELPNGKASVHRWRFHDHIAERFATAFCDTLGEWCEHNNIALTGHFLSERTLYSQTLALGEAMRGYRSFQLPGIDILADQKEYSTAKQAVSVARQDGREGVLSELYGVTEWDADFKTYKLQGDWQAALGITIRVPHLAFMSMEGEAKRDWPASISYQSPWYKEYPLVENHFSRLNTALTRGVAISRVGVIHPIESFWLAFGPNEQTQTAREQLDASFENLMQWLLFGLVDFDLISESLLPSQCKKGGAPLQVGLCSYDAILVPSCRTLRSSTMQILEQFVAAGGKLIFAGDIPTLENAVPTNRAAILAEKSCVVPYTRVDMLQALEPVRDISLHTSGGKRADNIFYQLRQDGDNRWLFLCHVNRKRSNAVENYILNIKGNWQVTVYDTATGEINAVDADIVNGSTMLELALYAQDSLLLSLTPISSVKANYKNRATLWVQKPIANKKNIVVTKPQHYSLSEPNALILSCASATLNGNFFCHETDILRLDNDLRKALNYPTRQDHFIQPWAAPEEMLVNKVELEYCFTSDITIDGCLLALERPENCYITLNGEKAGSDCGWYVDKFIRTVALPTIKIGSNIIKVSLPFGKKINLEAMYILGDFGVAFGVSPKIVPRPTELGFGDITRQGLLFYTGNVLYDFNFTLNSDEAVAVCVPHFSAPVVGVLVDGVMQGHIAYAPHQLVTQQLCKGRHSLRLCLYGNRFNGFGTLHNCNKDYVWYGPDSYRTTTDQWTESYEVRPVGILSRVELFAKGIYIEE